MNKYKGEFMILLGFVALLFFIGFITPTDDTDKSRWKRSGMYLYIDHGTGCHYLAGGGFFGKQVLIPRLDKDGNQVCEKR